MPDVDQCPICGEIPRLDTCQVHGHLEPAALPEDRWVRVLEWCGRLFGGGPLAMAGYLACRSLANPDRPETKDVLAVIQEERRLQRGKT